MEPVRRWDDGVGFEPREEERAHPEVYVGVDLGQAVDPTAIVVAQPVDAPAGEPRVLREYEDGSVDYGRERQTVYVVRHVERRPLRESYPEIERRVARIVEQLREREQRPYLIVDAGGVGRAVVDELRRLIDCSLTAVTITSTDRLEGGMGWEAKVGKAFLTSRLQSLLQRDRIRLPETPEARALADELKSFEITLTTRGMKAEARSGSHDDLVIALSLATLFDPAALEAQVMPSPW